MTKSELEKELQRERKTRERAAREEKCRAIAESIVRGQPVIYGVHIMDSDAESFLEAILAQYDGNVNNQVNFVPTDLSRSLEDSMAVQLKKLEMYGVLSLVIPHMGGAIITLSETAKTYKERKHEALLKQKEEDEKRNRLETDYLKIHNMTYEQLRDLYLQAVLVNEKLQQTLEIQERQLQSLKDLFYTNEDDVAVLKEIMKLLIEQEEKQHTVKEYLADKGGDIGVAALTAAAPIIWKSIKDHLIKMGVITL